MSPVSILDASLRDGGHRTNFHFKDDDLKQILVPLDNSGIEYIEIGYRNGSLHPIENIGKAGMCPKDYLLYCQSLIKKAKIAVMVHPHNVNDQDLLELKDCGVRLIRICIAKDEFAYAIPLIKLAKNMNLETSVNIIHISYYTENELDNLIEEISLHKPDMIYFADSNGSLFPDKINTLYKKYTSRYKISFGFHAHDNLGLAQANALAAVNTGVHFIDASLAGMGKGTGNLKTEFFIAYLHANNIKKYNLEDVLTAANFVRAALKIGQEPIEMNEFIRGISDLSTADLKSYKSGNL
ncbi:TPA: aldolase catalytic domain-containing protein [Legionella pneumophila]|uniref:Homocitrate synthase n=1 Tax=Legionella pneumophila TaxID=446 RepID=A0AAN5KTR3_LEGPN|nr:aldolase catalytic domain-containing protein [Legionella pneumophila]HAT1597725.1 4-hydroxy-2-oxovalerate aldolase [Legionella pneumophila]HAT1973075.1 4-hydroxy-2-oxovalerate aldolase [Legionella pneumophila]HAT8612299.1 4-hydroxy-2-oxovalerate aldolase [Legionella pneumophila]HBC0465777.1 aldolase catalytic domain-containing protein [Legionella pneumophila]HDP0036338.1 aldolase catalytic domain-containing protein [Legionella pneumophila]